MNIVVIAVQKTAFCAILDRYLQHRYGLRLTEPELCALRARIGSVYPLVCELSTPVKGVLVASEELREALRPVSKMLVEAVRGLRPTSVTLAGEAVAGLSLLLEDELGIPVNFAENCCQAGRGVVQ